MIELSVDEARLRLRRGDASVLLVELDYMYQVGVGDSAVPTVGTRYLSTGPYIDESVPRSYDDCITSVPNFQRALDKATLRGRYLPSVGALEISSEDGEHDDLLAVAIDGSDVRVSVAWLDQTFAHLFTAISLRVTAPGLQKLRVDLRDTGVLLNKSIGGMIPVGGTEPSANRYRPVNFGFCHQVDPILLDSGVPSYVHSDTGVGTAAVDVRNDGVSVTFTDNGDGTFDLAVPAAGNEKITCDVLATVDSGGTAYRGSDFLDWLIGDRAGLIAAGKYTGAAPTFEVDGFNDYHFGRSVPEQTNVLSLLDEAMDSLNTFSAFDRDGNFYYGTMRPEALAEIVGGSGGAIEIEAEINSDDIFDGRVSIDHNAPTYTGYQAYGNVNAIQQQTFATSLTETERDRYSRKGYVTAAYFGEDPGTTSYLGPVSFRGGAPQLYHLTMSDSQLIPTLISGPDDTTVIDVTALPVPQSVEDYLQDWASVRRSQRLPWMEFVDIVTGLDLYFLEIGDVVNMTHNRYGWDAGILHQVYSININPTDRQVTLGLCRRRYAGVLDTEGVSLELREDGGLELREDGGDELRE